MNKKAPRGSTARSSTEEASNSSVSDGASPSASRKQTAPKKGKSGRTVSSLTEDQLQRKRSNDRHAQRKIRERQRENVANLELALAERDSASVEKDHEIARKDHEIALLNQKADHLESEVRWYRDRTQGEYAHSHEGGATSIDYREQSVASDASKLTKTKTDHVASFLSIGAFHLPYFTT